jgi:signal transduction histidine kinase
VSVLVSPFIVQDIRAGAFATWLPRPSTGPIWTLGLRIAGVLLLALAVVGAVGVLISRVVLRQVRDLVATNEALAGGNLDARVRVGGTDELGRLAEGLNTMAEQLQASHSELERRVAARTEELQRLYEESVSASAAKGEFFAAISHELRTPLFVILGHAELMTHKELQPSERGWEEEFGRAIAGAAQDLLGRVNEILELSKLQTGKLELDVSDVSVADCVDAVASELAPLARAGKVALSVEVPPDLAPARADQARVRDVIRNLVSNAIKFTPAGGSVTVTASRQSRGRIKVSVIDTGVGIPPEAQQHLFEPFYQVPGIRPHGRQGSTGLGLAVASRLVEAHGGTLSVESAVGEGSTFSFTLRTSRKRAGAAV